MTFVADVAIDSIHTQAQENDEDTTWNGHAKHDNDLGKPRDGDSRIPIHKIVHKQFHRIICTYFLNIFSSKHAVSSNYSFFEM